MQNSSFGNLIQRPPEALIGAENRLESNIKSAQNAANGKQKDGLQKAAQEFEAVFINYLLKVMRETIEDSGLMEGGLGNATYTEMFDQELSLSLARRGSLGISKLILQGVTKSEAEKSSEATGETSGEKLSSPSDKKSPAEEGDHEISDIQLPIQAPISSRFGFRSDPFTHRNRFHKGIDLAAPSGTSVKAPLSGTVLSAGFESGYGNSVVIQHPGGLKTRYAHLGAIAVKTGDSISSQQVLGSVGDTGRSTGPHLHFEVMRDGKTVDPLSGNETRVANLEYANAASKKSEVLK
jgi:murein DD-endopeptidase MepM/ murein hydrolase activator NlpD